MPLTAQLSCSGKPYPSPGCPNLRPPLTPAQRANCGNEVIDNNEECDDGPANGTNDSTCNSSCRLRYCGDGSLQGFLGEQCEPPAQEYYAASGTGLVIERRFTALACGNNYCTTPACDASGCQGGCELVNLPACVSSSVSSAKSSSSSSKKGGTTVIMSGTASIGSSRSSVATVASAASSATKSSTAPSSAPPVSSALSSVASAAAVSSQASMVASSASKASVSSASTESSSAAIASSKASSSSSVSAKSSAPVGQNGVGLSVFLEGPLVVQRGQTAGYHITVSNNTSGVIRNVVVNDFLINYGSLETFTLDSDTGGTGKCSLTGISIRCSGFDLAPRETRLIRVTFAFLPTTKCEARQKADAYATVTGEIQDPDNTDNETDLLSTIVLCATASSESSRPPVVPQRSSSSTIVENPPSSLPASQSSQRSAGSDTTSSMNSASSASVSQVSSAPPPSAICGDGLLDPTEECDQGTMNGSQGSTCDTSCKRSIPGPPEEDDSTRILALRISYGVLALLVPAYLYVARRRWMKLFKDLDDEDLPDPRRKSIDDVPLDEIEMPWRKF